MKVDHLKSGCLSQAIRIPTLKCEYVNMDFIVGLFQTSDDMIEFGL